MALCICIDPGLTGVKLTAALLRQSRCNRIGNRLNLNNELDKPAFGWALDRCTHAKELPPTKNVGWVLEEEDIKYQPTSPLGWNLEDDYATVLYSA